MNPILDIFKGQKKKNLKLKQQRARESRHFDKQLSQFRFHQLEGYQKFEHALRFQSIIKENKMPQQEREFRDCIKVIQNLYEKIVPEYLIEDHPTGVPEIVVPLIKSQINTRSNGKDAQVMEQEFGLIFRENELASGTNFKNDKLGSGGGEYQKLYELAAGHDENKIARPEELTPQDEEEMKRYVDRKMAERQALRLRKQVIR